MNGNGYNKYVSRRFGLTVAIVLIASALTWVGKLGGPEWVAAVVAIVAQYTYHDTKESIAMMPYGTPPTPPAGG